MGVRNESPGDDRVHDAAAAGGGSAWMRRAGDLSGAFADLGTFLPLVIGVFAVQGLDPSGVLVGFGLFALATAWAYRRPVPVQPMKVVAALVIAGGLGPAGVMATGIVVGVVLIGLAAFGLVGRFGGLVAPTVMNGIQLGVGLYLAWAGVKLTLAQPWLGAVALALLLLLQLTRFKPLAALAVVVAAVAYGVWDSAALPRLTPSLYLPGFDLPDTQALWQAVREVALPQLALTLTNATIITAAIAAEYFPRDRERITPDRLAMSTGVFNVALAPFGAFPMCHGAGGLVVQYRFGARTGLAPVIFGLSCLALGLLLGEQALTLLGLLPLAVVGALLLVAGIDLAFGKGLRHAEPDAMVVIVLTGLVCASLNVAIGLIVGLILEWLRRVYRRRVDV